MRGHWNGSSSQMTDFVRLSMKRQVRIFCYIAQKIHGGKQILSQFLILKQT
jgi:hypothetical protein